MSGASFLDILRQFENMVEVILPHLPASLDSVPDPSGKAALIWILGEYGEVRTCSTTTCTRDQWTTLPHWTASFLCHKLPGCLTMSGNGNCSHSCPCVQCVGVAWL